MSADANKQAVQAVFAAFARGDAQAALAMLRGHGGCNGNHETGLTKRARR